MKIWIDARICEENSYYTLFITQLIEEISERESEHSIYIYQSEKFPLNKKKKEKTSSDRNNIHFITLKTSKNSFSDIFRTKKIYETQKFHMMIFFDTHIPLFYSGAYIIVLESLKEVFFPKKKWVERKLYTFRLKYAIEKCLKVVVLDKNSAFELNENLNISEEKIARIPAFFPHISSEKEALSIDVQAKHNIKWNYLIYDSWNEVHNNFERILKSLKKLKENGNPLCLIILCDATSKDLDIREKVIEFDLMSQVIFLWNVDKNFEKSYYTQSAGVIFSSIYESFPFHFTKALSYEVPIFANDIPAHKEVMKETIVYLDPLSVHTMADTLQEKTQENILFHTSYNFLMKNYNPKNTSESLMNIIEGKE